MTGTRLLSLMAALLTAVPSAAFAGGPVAVPEPSSVILLAAGLGGAAILKFRKRK